MGITGIDPTATMATHTRMDTDTTDLTDTTGAIARTGAVTGGAIIDVGTRLLKRKGRRPKPAPSWPEADLGTASSLCGQLNSKEGPAEAGLVNPQLLAREYVG